MVRTNPDLARRDFTWKDYCRAENSHFNRENTLTVRSASISRVTQKKFFFYRRAETRRVGTSLAVQWLLSAFQCRGTKISRALGQMSLCAPTREGPKHHNLWKACAQQQRPTTAKEVRKWHEQQWSGQVVDHTPFFQVQPALRRACKLRAGLWEGQNLNQDLVRKHFVPVDQWEQVI